MRNVVLLFSLAVAGMAAGRYKVCIATGNHGLVCVDSKNGHDKAIPLGAGATRAVDVLAMEDGSLMFATYRSLGSAGVAVIDQQTLRVIDDMPSSGSPARMATDGDYLYVAAANPETGVVDVYDIRKHAVSGARAHAYRRTIRPSHGFPAFCCVDVYQGRLAVAATTDVFLMDNNGIHFGGADMQQMVGEVMFAPDGKKVYALTAPVDPMLHYNLFVFDAAGRLLQRVCAGDGATLLWGALAGSYLYGTTSTGWLYRLNAFTDTMDAGLWISQVGPLSGLAYSANDQRLWFAGGSTLYYSDLSDPVMNVHRSDGALPPGCAPHGVAIARTKGKERN
jgi:DNA-binding beta-propeller fold protein YncE